MYTVFGNKWLRKLKKLQELETRFWGPTLTSKQKAVIRPLIIAIESLHSTETLSNHLAQLKNIEAVLEEARKLKNFKTLYYNFVINNIFNEYQIMLDRCKKRQVLLTRKRPPFGNTIYDIPKFAYRESITMLPASQFFDFSIHKGHCAGFAFQFISDFLSGKKKSFGIYRDQPSPFALIQGGKDLNHLIRLSPDIENYQIYQNDYQYLAKKELYLQRTVVGYANSFHDYTQDMIFSVAAQYKINTKIAFRLRMHNSSGGHAISVCINETGICDVFDANVGWIRYDSVKSFKSNFPNFLTDCYAKNNYSWWEVKTYDSKPQPITFYENIVRPIVNFMKWLRYCFLPPSAPFFKKKSICPSTVTVAAVPPSPHSSRSREFKSCKSTYFTVGGILDHDQQKIEKAAVKAQQDPDFGIEAYKKARVARFSKMAAEGIVSKYDPEHELPKVLVEKTALILKRKQAEKMRKHK